MNDDPTIRVHFNQNFMDADTALQALKGNHLIAIAKARVGFAGLFRLSKYNVNTHELIAVRFIAQTLTGDLHYRLNNRVGLLYSPTHCLAFIEYHEQ